MQRSILIDKFEKRHLVLDERVAPSLHQELHRLQTSSNGGEMKRRVARLPRKQANNDTSVNKIKKRTTSTAERGKSSSLPYQWQGYQPSVRPSVAQPRHLHFAPRRANQFAHSEPKQAK